MQKKTVTWYFDFISPFAFLQWPAIKQLSKSVHLVAKPVLFAGLLNHWGHLGPAEIPEKRRFTYRHVQWLAQRMGRDIRFPPAHPFNPLKALRLAVYCEASMVAIDAVFNYLWVEGRGLNDDPEFSGLCESLGVIDPDVLLGKPEVKARLKRNGLEAVDEGVFGVPTAVVDHVLFWGLDATEMLRDFLLNPGVLTTDEMVRIADLPLAVSRVRIN